MAAASLNEGAVGDILLNGTAGTAGDSGGGGDDVDVPVDDDLMLFLDGFGGNSTNGSSLFSNGTDDDACAEEEVDQCYLHTYDTTLTMMRGLGEVVLVVWALVYLVKAAREVTFLGPRLFLTTLSLCPSRQGREGLKMLQTGSELYVVCQSHLASAVGSSWY